jgi:hypothetical protein
MADGSVLEMRFNTTERDALLYGLWVYYRAKKLTRSEKRLVESA